MPGTLPRPRPADDRGASAVEFSLIVPLVFGMLGMAVFVGLAFIQGSLLDRAAEIAVREIAIDGDIARATAEAAAATPLITLTGPPTVLDEDGAPLVGRPSSGERYTVTFSTTVTNPTAPLTAAVMGGDGVGATLTLTRTARGLGQ